MSLDSLRPVGCSINWCSHTFPNRVYQLLGLTLCSIVLRVWRRGCEGACGVASTGVCMLYACYQGIVSKGVFVRVIRQKKEKEKLYQQYLPTAAPTKSGRR